jgi:hypothetical protein
MAMITGRVQIQESTKPREIEVGNAFARNENGQWKNLEGKSLNRVSISAKDIQKRIEAKKKAS